MNPEQTGRLLAICAAFDRRTVGRADLLAWYRVLGDLDFAECEAAVIAHYTDRRDFVMPADIRTRVRQRRRETAEREHSRVAIDPDAYRAHTDHLDAQFLQKLATRTGRTSAAAGRAISAGRNEPA